jgi:hypothetical protein
MQRVGDLVVMMSALHAERRGFEPRPAYLFLGTMPLQYKSGKEMVQLC